MTLFWIVFLVCGAIGTTAGASLIMTGIKSSGWSKTKGLILSSEVTTSYNEHHSKTTMTPVVTYKYALNGREYQSRQVSTGDHGSGDIKQARKVVERYCPGMEVTVFFNPNDPGNAVLEPGLSISSVIILGVGVVFFCAAILGLLGFIGKKWGSAFP